MEKKKLSVSTGLCYAGGDVGCNIVFGMIGHGCHCREDQFQMGKIKTLASVDEHSVCAVSSTAFHSAAYNRDASVSVSLCNL